MEVIDGKKIAQEILDGLKQRVAAVPFRPVFCDVLVGEDPASLSYVNIKGKTAEALGLEFKLVKFSAGISEQELISEVRELNKLSHLCGLIVQLPLPAAMDRQAVLDAIDPRLDVDCLGTPNMQKFYAGESSLVPPTAAAILELVSRLPESYGSGSFVVVGQGQLVGKPLAYLLKRHNKAVQVATQSTTDLPAVTRSADVLITGIGHPKYIGPEMVKQSAAVIDAGTAEIDGAISGDVDYETVSKKTAFITPVPGGVGPVTVAMLLSNVVAVAEGKT